MDAASGRTIDRVSPGHAGVVVGTWPEASADDVRLAVATARRAFITGPGRACQVRERSRLMFKVADLILKNQEELALAESLEVGKPIAQARGEIGFCADLWSYAAGQARTLEGQAHNNIGDDRLGLVLRGSRRRRRHHHALEFSLHHRLRARAVGDRRRLHRCPQAVEFTSASIRMAELAREAGIPDGVFNVVTGYGDPGRPGARRRPRRRHGCLHRLCARRHQAGEIAARSVKRVGLELGGKGPQIVFADADLEAAADGIAYGVYHNGGQCCISGSRLLVRKAFATR